MNKLSSAEQISYLVKNRKKLIIEGEVSGRVMSYHGMKTKRINQMKNLIKNLENEFYLVNHDGTASLKRGLIITVIGLLFVFLGFKMFRKK